MERLLFLYFCVGATLAKAVHPRQADGAVSSSLFLRRAYHNSAVLNGRVYIDGGEFSYSGSSGVTYAYSSTLLSIDLSEDFTPASVAYSSTQKPSGVPDLDIGGIWVDKEAGLLYTGFAGTPPGGFSELVTPTMPKGLWSFQPDSSGSASGTWTNLNSSADSAFTTNLRPFLGPVASGNGTGFFLGGQVTINNTRVSVSGLLQYDFASKTLVNSTVTGISTNGYVQLGRMQYVPNFGPAGILVAAGGHQLQLGTTEKYLLSFNTVQIFDPSSQTWYEQTTTGDIPEGRKEYCMTGAASSNKTYEIFVYAGWDGNLGSTSIPWDEAFVLSLPSFHWFKASYSALHPRHGLTCEHIGGGQILTIGGVDTTQNGGTSSTLYEAVFDTTDTFSQGLGVFDMGSLAFSTGFTSNQTTYNLASDVQNYYNNHDRMADFTSTGLAEVFAVENFTAAVTDSTGTSSTGEGDSSSTTYFTPAAGNSNSSSTSNTGAIAGGVVGGVAGLALMAVGVLYFLRRRRNSQKTAQVKQTEGDGNSRGGYYGVPHHGGEYVTDAEMPAPGPEPVPRAEAPGTMPYAEMAEGKQYAEMASGNTRHELA